MQRFFCIDVTCQPTTLETSSNSFTSLTPIYTIHLPINFSQSYHPDFICTQRPISQHCAMNGLLQIASTKTRLGDHAAGEPATSWPLELLHVSFGRWKIVSNFQPTETLTEIDFCRLPSQITDMFCVYFFCWAQI